LSGFRRDLETGFFVPAIVRKDLISIGDVSKFQ
jgi:hypothetical protein